MNSEKLSNWLTLLVNIGVVIGLALLIYELRESQNLAETGAAVRLRMRSQYAEYARGYLDHDTAELIVETASGFLPYWEELGYELGESEFEQAIGKAAGR